jgi:hypothetical protein
MARYYNAATGQTVETDEPHPVFEVASSDWKRLDKQKAEAQSFGVFRGGTESDTEGRFDARAYDAAGSRSSDVPRQPTVEDHDKAAVEKRGTAEAAPEQHGEGAGKRASVPLAGKPASSATQPARQDTGKSVAVRRAKRDE